MTTATDKKEKDPRTVQLKGVRLSFTDSLKDKKATVEDGKPKHALNMILEKASPHFAANKEKIKVALEEAGERQWKNRNKYIAIMEDDPKRVCYRKGERFKNKEGQVYKGYEGNMAIAGGTPGGGQRRPKLYDRRKKYVAENDILEVVYGGSYADVIVSFYGTEKGGLGIFCTVEAIRSHQEGERMGGGWVGDANEFDDMEDAENAFEGTSAVEDLLG